MHGCAPSSGKMEMLLATLRICSKNRPQEVTISHRAKSNHKALIEGNVEVNGSQIQNSVQTRAIK